MKHAYLTCAAAALLLATGTMAAQEAPAFPPLDTRPTRTGQIPMASPEASYQSTPFIQNMMPISSNPVLSHRKAQKAAREEGTEDEYKPTIYGIVISNSAQYGWSYNGLRILPMTEGEAFSQLPGVYMSNTSVASGAEQDGYFYTNTITERYGVPYCTYNYVYDMNNRWQSVMYSNQGSHFLYAARDMATDPVTGDIYGCCVKTAACQSYVLARVDYGYDANTRSINPKREAICDLENMLTGLFFTADGQLWGIDLVYGADENDADKTVCVSSSLYKIDKQTGEMTLIGDTGAKPFYVSSVACDIYGNGKVYWAIKDINNVGSLYTVDLETGAATKLFDFPNNEEVVAMHVPMQASQKAPAAPENLTMEFPEGALSGHITFDIPTTLADGTEAEGMVDWEVIFNGAVIGEGTAEVGSHIECPAEVSQPANYSYSARLKNANGKSVRAQVNGFIGTGVPATPEPVVAHAGKFVMVTWEPITSAAYDRGYVDVDNITYDVIRYPDNTVVSTGKKDCFYTENVGTDPEFGYYSYGVKAVIGDTWSGEGKTSTVVLGNIVPPFMETWDDANLIGYGDNILTGVYPNYDLDGSTLGHWYVHTGQKAATCSTGFGDENSWLLTPGFKFEEGKSYTISFITYTGYVPTKNENGQKVPDESKFSRLSVTMGTGQNPDAQTIDILPEFTVINLQADPEFKVADFTVPATGVYYLGFHCSTLNGGAQVYFDNMLVEESPENGIPGPVSNMTVKAEATGSLNTIISATAPKIDNRGVTLSDNVTLTLTHDGEVVDTKENVTPGETVTFNHTVLIGGDKSYTLVASNDKGESRPVSASAYVGFYAPRAAENVKIAVNYEDEEFTISWKAPTIDIKWNQLTANDMTFTILGVDAQGKTVIVMDGIPGSDTSATISDDNVDFNGDQRFVYYGVAVTTNGGTSDIAVSNILPIGEPYKAPYYDSFSGEPSGIYTGAAGDTFGQWFNLSDSDIDIVSSQDGDNGYLGFCGQMWNTQGVLQTGLIDISDLERPGISFWMYNIYLDGIGFDDNDIVVALNDGDGVFYTIKAEVDQVGNFGKMNAWTKYVVSLESIKHLPNKVYSFAIIPTVKSYIWNFIDNLMIGDLPEVDLAAGPSAGTPLIEEGNYGYYIFNIINNGYSTAEDFSANLLRNGKIVNTRPIGFLEAGDWMQISITDKPDVDAEGEAEYLLQVIADNDDDDSDNESDPIKTNIVLPSWPTVEMLEGKLSENGVELSWETPNLNYIPWPKTETFETGEAWQQEFGDWTFVDVDEAPINLGTANGFFGDIHTGDAATWFVMDVSELDEQRQGSVAFTGHSGVRYLVKCAPGNATVKGDDWVISPELFGEAQTVSLWAHSHSSNSPENIEILYSTGSTDPADFISAGKWIDVPTGWTEYKAELPAGAKRMAIRANSAGTFLLQLDDVTYQPAPVDLELIGYHVWRNGQRVTKAPVTETNFVDEAGVGIHSYRVSPVYHVGEAIPGVEVKVENSGLANALLAGLTVKASDGYIIVNGASGQTINVYTVEGRQVASVAGLASNVIPVANGVYMVSVADTVTKVIVK